MYYDINKFPEGTAITQKYIEESDFYQNSILLYLDGNANRDTTTGNYMPYTVAYYTNDFSKIKRIHRGIRLAELVKIGNTVIRRNSRGTLETDIILDLDLSSCEYLNYLFESNMGIVFDKVILRNFKPTKGFENVTYMMPMKELEFVDCDFSALNGISYFQDNAKYLQKISAMKFGDKTTIMGLRDAPVLTEFGGFIGLRRSLTGELNKWSNLNYNSCINVLNGLYDFTGNGVTPTSNEGKLQVHQNFINTVGADISIGTDKGWTITT